MHVDSIKTHEAMRSMIGSLSNRINNQQPPNTIIENVSPLVMQFQSFMTTAFASLDQDDQRSLMRKCFDAFMELDAKK